ncbi:MAG: potassium channel family protein, partial [bacterium]
RPFGVLLLSLFLMMVLSPCTSLLTASLPNFHGITALAPLSLLVICASLLTLWQAARHHASHMFAGAGLILLLTLGSLITHRAMALTQIAAQIIFLGYVLLVVERAVFHSKEVTGDILCGAVCVYLLFGILSGFIFLLIEHIVPGSFLISNLGVNSIQQQDLFIHDPGWLLYFSFVTLTTVGYGDVLPANSIARSASVLVAVTGQILLMVQIARLVGLHVAQGSEPTNGSAK